jgi:thiamine-phosphate pyrophosphorylase
MLLYLIGDRRALGPDPVASDRLVALVADAADAGIDLVQIREPDLAAGALVRLVARAMAAVGDAARVLVNDRLDVALAAGADGVHLTTRSMSPAVVRAAVGSAIAIGVSTHSPDEVAAAEAGAADFVVCGPVYDTPSKRGMGEPLGPERVRRIAAGARVPVVALGGVTRENAREASRGVAGVAAIRMFQDAWLAGGRAALAALAAELRGGI